MRAFSAIALLILLASPCYAGQLRVGYAKEDITPTEPVQMGGYDLREGLSEGVHEGDHLFVRALCINDGATSVLFVESDLIGVCGFDEFRDRVASATGIPKDHVLWGDVHNHAAPCPEPAGKVAYDRKFNDAALAAAKKAVANLQPAKIASGEGRSRVAMNRRQARPADGYTEITFDENNSSQSFGKYKTDKPVKLREFGGVMRLGANPTGPIDDAVQLVRIDDAAGKPLAVMIHYACHGTSLGGRNGKISGEWMGRMMAHAEKDIPGLGAMFVQGAAGNINPRAVGGLDGFKDDIHTTWALGDEIGEEVVRVYRRLEPQPIDAKIELVTKQIELPRAYRELMTDFRNTTVPVSTTVVKIGPMMWVTSPAELFSEIGKKVKAACPAPYAYIMGYTNGHAGYLPTQQAFAEGGYEPTVSPFDPTAEAVYLREISAMLKDFH